MKSRVNVFNRSKYEIDTRYYRFFLYNAVILSKIDGEVNLLFSDDDYMTELNREFRGKDKSTDVLTFPSGGVRDGGDIIISNEWVVNRYREENIRKTIIKLIVHSILHLKGIHHTYSRKSLKLNYIKMKKLYKKIVFYIKQKKLKG